MPPFGCRETRAEFGFGGELPRRRAYTRPLQRASPTAARPLCEFQPEDLRIEPAGQRHGFVERIQERASVVGHPSLARRPRSEKEDEMAKRRHDVRGGLVKLGPIRNEERDHGALRLHSRDAVWPDLQSDNFTAFGVRRLNVGRGVEKLRNEQAVPGAPSPQSAAVHSEYVVHGRGREAAEAEDAAALIWIDEGIQ